MDLIINVKCLSLPFNALVPFISHATCKMTMNEQNNIFFSIVYFVIDLDFIGSMQTIMY